MDTVWLINTPNGNIRLKRQSIKKIIKMKDKPLIIILFDNDEQIECDSIEDNFLGTIYQINEDIKKLNNKKGFFSSMSNINDKIKTLENMRDSYIELLKIV